MQHDRGAMLVGLGLGASLMYFLDPSGGGRRRALMRDRFAHASHLIGGAADATRRDVANRASGALARLRRARRNGPVDDRVLVERVRAQLGRSIAHPRAIDVEANDGRVTLRGPILQSEVARVCETVARVKGVQEIVDELDARDSSDNMPALQGGTVLPAPWRRHWSPTTRLVTALAATAGAGLIARAATARH